MSRERLKAIRLLLLDVDGVLTDGGIIYDDNGCQTKVFNSRDGLGLRLVMDAGIGVGIVTGRSGQALRHRCENLGIRLIFDGVADKAALVDEIAGQTGIAPEAMAFVGDDLPDLPIMNRVGLAVAVADAHLTVRAKAHRVTEAGGGKGAVREICEEILKAQGKWAEIEERFS